VAARAMWKGTLEIARIAIPVKLYAAAEERDVHFRLLHAKDRVPVRQEMFDPATDKAVDPDEIRRGIEVEPGVFVALAEDELDSAQPEPSRSIELTRFVPRDAVDVSWYDRPYFVGPDGSAADYAALAEALARSERIGIARWVMRGRRYFGALQARDGRIALLSLHSASEVVPVEELPRPGGPTPSPAERKLAEQLVATLDGPFEPAELRDDHRARVEKLVAAKHKGRKYTVKEAPAPRAGGDLAAALRKSLGKSSKSKERRRAAA
jgi:DNA end-binding protein Ku